MTAKLTPVVLALTLSWVSALQAASDPLRDPDITPDTVYHRAGQQLPVQSRPLRPFDVDELATTVRYLAPVNIQATDFTAVAPQSRVHPDDLISHWGRAH